MKKMIGYLLFWCGFRILCRDGSYIAEWDWQDAWMNGEVKP